MCGTRNSSLWGKITVLVVICFFVLPAQAKYGGGSGTAEYPYLIYTADQMNAIGADSNDWDKHFKLMADIDLSAFTGTSFNVIGYYINHRDNKPFTGVFDGNGHTISNFMYISTRAIYTGLFGYVVGKDTEIKDLDLINPHVDAGTGYCVGSLVGRFDDGTVNSCYVNGGSVSGSGYFVGGLTGRNEGTITNCYSSSSVNGSTHAGGLVGYSNGTIINSCSVGRVLANGRRVGGLVGGNDGSILSSYSEGNVSGNGRTGGLIGENNGLIINCYSIGSVSGGGGLVGADIYNYGVVRNSFWDIQSSGQTSSAGGLGKTTAEMQTASTFIGWGCGDVWTIDEGKDYPRLFWENMDGEQITMPSYGGGNGEPNDPYLIYTDEQLNTIGLVACDWDKHFKLMADIDLYGFSGTAFNIIGSWQDEKPFTGVFDGNDHKISNFNCTFPDGDFVGLFGYVFDADAEIKNLGLIAPDVDAGTGGQVGAMVGQLQSGTITNCFVEGGIVRGRVDVGGIVGRSWGNITNCCFTGSVAGSNQVGGLVGFKCYGTITNCYSAGSQTCKVYVGGLVGINASGAIDNCYSSSTVLGDKYVGGIVGGSYGIITNCYSSGTVSGTVGIGGLMGSNWLGEVTNCYSMGSVTGYDNVGGLVGYHNNGSYIKCFWDNTVNSGLSGIGNTTDPNVIGESTTNMQIENTFTDAGWDFENSWWILEGAGYPRLWWELVPLLHAEPEVTLGNINTISWDPVIGAVEYYAECGEDVNFTNIVYNSGWITKTTYEFTGLQSSQRYWYSVKARNEAGAETCWSNVEKSLQGTLADAVETLLNRESMKNKNMKNALLNKIDEVLEKIDEGLYKDALNELQNDILQKTDGCTEMGEPDKNDWIITCEAQDLIYPLVIETIEYVKGFMEQSP
ncbi:MAG: GLUG motif-containing protein [Planctomycetota bacterium]|jgi:hypothetical protein